MKPSNFFSWLTVIIATVAVVSCNAYPSTFKLHEQGIDVSHHNKVDWKTVSEKTDIKFAFVKITEGSSFVDSKGKKNILEAERNGIKTGAYHFLTPRTSAKRQFDNFNRHYVRSASLYPMVDVEMIKGTTKEKLNKLVKEYCLLVEDEYGVKPIIYTSPELYNMVFKPSKNFWKNYTFFIWNKFPKHPYKKTGLKRCIWQYDPGVLRTKGAGHVDKDVLSEMSLDEITL